MTRIIIYCVHKRLEKAATKSKIFVAAIFFGYFLKNCKILLDILNSVWYYV